MGSTVHLKPVSEINRITGFLRSKRFPKQSLRNPLAMSRGHMLLTSCGITYEGLRIRVSMGKLDSDAMQPATGP